MKLTHSTLGTFIYLHPAGKGQLLYEKEVKPSGLTEHKNYITAGAMLVGVYISKSDSSPPVQRYFHHDHLGSLTLITNASGVQVERFAYEAFGKRRYPDGTDDTNNGLFGITTDRGFTGHEHLDEIALIHMNGRVYDPALGRFMTADPFIGGATNLQSYNRYSYVNNNPLAYLDPDGYWKIKIGPIKFGKSSDIKKVATVAAIVFAPQISAWAQGVFLNSLTLTSMAAYESAIFASQIVGGAVSGFTLGFAASGGDINTAFKGAIAGGIGGGITGYFGSDYPLQRVAAEGVASGINSRISGGSFEDGFRQGIGISALAYVNVQARNFMIEQSRQTLANSSGISAGLFGDGFKLAGARMIETLSGSLRSPSTLWETFFGGIQGGQGSLAGFDYYPRGIVDRVLEAWGGPHDLFNFGTGSYTPDGNAYEFSGLRKLAGEVGNVTGVLIVAPVAVSGLIRSEGLPVGLHLRR